MNVITEDYIRTELDKMVKAREAAKRMSFEEQKKPVGRPPRPPVQKLKGRYESSSPRPPESERKLMDPELLIYAVERVTGVTRTAICKSHLRVNHIMIARHLTTWLLLMHTKMSLSQSGYMTGRSDHSSALNSFNVVIDNPKVFKPLIDKVYSQLMVNQNATVCSTDHMRGGDAVRRGDTLRSGAPQAQV